MKRKTKGGLVNQVQNVTAECQSHERVRRDDLEAIWDEIHRMRGDEEG